MKNLILENDNEQDGIPRRLQNILDKGRFSEDQEFWFGFHTAFYPENSSKTMSRFLSLEDGGSIVCQTVFDGWMQLELIVELLIQFKDLDRHVNFHILIPDLKSDIQEYLDEHESELTPDTDEYDEDPELRTKFKNLMDSKLIEAMDYHGIYHLSKRNSELLKSENFKIKK